MEFSGGTLGSRKPARVRGKLPVSGPLPLPLGSQLGPWQLEAAVGKGGQAAVYLARHRKIDRVAAIKVPLDGRDERLVREARALGKLRHPAIVQVEDLIQEPRPYLVMEFLAGGNLADLVRQHRNGVPEEQVLEVAEAVLRALDCAHRKGIVHRDLKPENVLRDAQGAWKVGDFGLSGGAVSELANSLSSADGGVGTPLYVAPEQARPELLQGSKLDGRADLFSYGKLLYHMLTGQSPSTIRPLAQIRPRLHWLWERLIFGLVEEDRYKRPATADRVLDALGTIRRELNQGRVSVELGPTRHFFPRRKSDEGSREGERFRRWLRLCIVPAVLFVIGAATGWRAFTAIGGLLIIASGIYIAWD